MLQDLLPQAERIAEKLKARKETISVAESSTAGMISAALLAVPGASAYFIGGAVVYTRQSRTELLRVTEAAFAAIAGIAPSTYPFVAGLGPAIHEPPDRPLRLLVDARPKAGHERLKKRLALGL